MLQREFQHNSTYETGLQVVQVMNDALNMKPKPLAASLFVELETVMLSHAELYCIKRLQFLAASHTSGTFIYMTHIYIIARGARCIQEVSQKIILR